MGPARVSTRTVAETCGARRGSVCAGAGGRALHPAQRGADGAAKPGDPQQVLQRLGER